MPHILDKKTQAAKPVREVVAAEASKKKEMVDPDASVAEQEKKLQPMKEAAVVKKAPDAKTKSVEEDAEKKSPAPAKETVEATQEAAEKKDYFNPIYKLEHAAAAASLGKIKNAREIDEHIAAGQEMINQKIQEQSFTQFTQVRDAIVKLEAAKKALNEPAPPEEAVKEVVAEAKQKEVPKANAAAIAEKATALIAGASGAQAEKLAAAAGEVKKNAT